jgi:hypothetical protein
MSEYHLTELIHAEPKKGESFRLYVYAPDGYHSRAQWFTSGTIKYPNEQIDAVTARRIVEHNIALGHEVRITDGGDFLVFHSEHGQQLYPAPHIDFWSQV